MATINTVTPVVSTSTPNPSSNRKPSYAELQAEIAKLQQALAAKPQGQQQIRIKLSEKGAVSVYGLSARFPVTLYASQWEALAVACFGFKDIAAFHAGCVIGKFIAENPVSRKE